MSGLALAKQVTKILNANIIGALDLSNTFHLANNAYHIALASKSPLITYRLFDAYFSVVNTSKQFFRDIKQLRLEVKRV